MILLNLYWVFFSQILENLFDNLQQSINCVKVQVCSHHRYHHHQHHDEVDFLRHYCFVAICFRSERSVCKQPEELRGPWSRHQRVPAQNLGGSEEPHAHRDPRAQPEADRALQDQQPQVQNSTRSRNLDRLDFYRREYKS